MPRFFFHIHHSDGAIELDDRGINDIDVGDLHPHARALALFLLMRHDIMGDAVLVIEDENRNRVLQASLDALRFKLQ